MLQDPYIQVQVMLAARLGELLFDWAYNWIRGKGGYFLEGDGVGRRLFPGMRLVELADFSLLFLRKLEYLRAYHEGFFPFARTYLKLNEVRGSKPTRNQLDTRCVSWRVARSFLAIVALLLLLCVKNCC